MLKFISFLLLTLLPMIDVSASEKLITDDSIYIKKLKALSFDIEWLAINHYKKSGNNQWQSGITNSAFFLSHKGQTDPYSELLVTYQALDIYPEKKIHCDYPARVYFLKKHLAIDVDFKSCPDYVRWIKNHSTDRVTLIYPSTYLNNPSSTFGHTFLRFDNDAQPTPLSFTVDYAAFIPEKPSFTEFVIKGITGGFKGYYSYHPYYVKTWQYSDKENRKIWEYSLTLNNKEIHRLLNHLWELRNFSIEYYFIKENCSYQILSLLRSARPELQFENSFRFNTFPLDTIRYLEDNGLIIATTYTPTLRETILDKYNSLTTAEKDKIDQVIEEDMTIESMRSISDSNKNQATVNNLLFDLASYRLKNTGSSNQSQTASAIIQFLQTEDLDSDYQTITAGRVDFSHRLSRFSVGLNHNTDDNLLLSYRHSYHSFDDPLNNFTPGTETEVFHIQFQQQDNQLKLDQLTLIRLTSIQADELIFSPVSWQFDLSTRKILFDNNEHFLSSVHLAIGKSLQFYNTKMYFLPALSLNNYSEQKNFLQPGSGLIYGLVKQHEKSVFRLESQYKQIRDSNYYLQYEVSYSRQLEKDISLSYSYQQTRTKALTSYTNQLLLNFYF